MTESAPDGPRRDASELTPRWRFFAGIIIPLILAVSKFTWHRVDRIPATGPFILTPNHLTEFDPLVSAYTLVHHGRASRFLAKESLFRVPVLGAILRSTGQVPVQRTGGGADPLAAATRIVDEGLAIIIYPEGTLTRDPDEWPMRGKFGAAKLALEHGIPVIPMAHWGAQKVLPRWTKKLSLFPRKRVDVLIGEPVDLSPWAGRTNDPRALAEATRAIMDAIAGLLGELRGETPPVERWDPAAHGQSEFGKLD